MTRFTRLLELLAPTFAVVLAPFKAAWDQEFGSTTVTAEAAPTVAPVVVPEPVAEPAAPEVVAVPQAEEVVEVVATPVEVVVPVVAVEVVREASEGLFVKVVHSGRAKYIPATSGMNPVGLYRQRKGPKGGVRYDRVG